MHGQLSPRAVERAQSFDDATDYTPTLPGMAADAAPHVGRWGYCAPTDAAKTIFHCFVCCADGTVVSVPQKPVGTADMKVHHPGEGRKTEGSTSMQVKKADENGILFELFCVNSSVGDLQF